MAQDNQIIAEIIVEGADQFKAQLQSSRKEVQAFDDDQKELNNTLVDAKNKLKDLETQGKANNAEYKKLENETKAVEISMQSQGKATDSLRTQQRKLKEEYADLRIKMEQLEKANLKGTDSYKLLEQRMQVVQQEAGSLNDLMGDVSSEISQLGSDTQGIDKTLRGVTALAGGFSAVQGVMALFGSENEAIEKTLLKVNATMAIASGTQQLFTELRAKDSIFIAIQTKAQQLYNLVVGQSTGALKLLRIAMLGLGIGAVIGGVYLLVKAFQAWNKESIDLAKVQKILSDSRKEATQNISSEIGELTKLTIIAKNESLSKKDRQNAINQINENYPEYLNNISLENIATEKANDLIKSQTELLIKREQVKLLTTKIAEEQLKKDSILRGDELDAIAKTRMAINNFFGFQKDANRIKNENILNDYKEVYNSIDANKKALNILLQEIADTEKSVFDKTSSEVKKSTKENSRVVLNELEKLKAELQKKQKELETEVSKLVVKEGKTESKLSIDLRAKITGIDEQIRVIENLINGNPLELKAKLDLQIQTGEDFEQNLKRSIDEAKAKFRDLFNIIFESGGDVATDPELKAQAEKIKILEQQLEDALKLYDDYFKEAEEKATYSNEQIFTIEQEKTKLLRNEYLTRLDELTNFYNEGLISEQEYNEAVKDLGEQRNATLQENIGKATEIFGYLNQVATEASQLATDIIQQNAEKELATLDDKKKRGVISEKQYEKEVAKVKNEQARKQKAVETAQAFLKVPQVILNTLAQVPFPANLVLAPILGALALAQAIRVAKAPLPKFRDGGFADRIFKGSGKVVGKSHAQGGVNAELEGNEYVMQGKAVSFYGQDFMKAVNNMNYQPPTLKTKDIYYPKEDKLSSKLDLIASYTKQSYKTVEKSNQLLSSINQNTKTGKNARV